ncbi:ATP-binding protein [Streptomyces sp. NPDC048270]|uniref:sensor histidine kinase n=1 Tax=Streptomyces sp. NPDC048270 TaxID=3154615 RepID=UPI0033FBA44A
MTLTYGALFALASVAMIGLLYIFMRYVPTYPKTFGDCTQSSPRTQTAQVAPLVCEQKSANAAKTSSVAAAPDTPQPSEPPRSSDSKTEADKTTAALPPDGGDEHPTTKSTFAVATRSDILSNLLIFSAISLMILLAIALILGWFMAGRMLAPLQRITAIARGIAGSTLHERITLNGPKDEIRELASTFNAMLQRLDQSFQAQSRFAANASHELRTPLASMRTVLQVAMSAPEKHRLEDVGTKLLILNRRTTEIADALLALARADHGAVNVEAVELHALAEEGCLQAAVQARSANVTLALQAVPVQVRGDRVLIRQLITNLVDNAIRHNHSGGWVDVRVGEQTDGKVRLTVSNSGEELSHDQVSRAFEPFHRLATRQADLGNRATGHGLGLAIVQSIVRAHHGNLEAVPLREGGIQVTATLPADCGRSTHQVAMRD